MLLMMLMTWLITLMRVPLRILLALAVEAETMDTWCGWLRIKLETCLVGVFVHWRKVSAAQAGHDVEPYLADKGGDQGRMSC